MSKTTSDVDPKKVFVVHGRNDRIRAEIFGFLRAVGLSPVEWSTAVEATGHPSPYIGDVLTTAFDSAQAVLVLLTPDDVVYLHQSLAGENDASEVTPQGQARPNVLFEAGMAMGRDKGRTVLVEMGPQKSFSDIGGRHTLRMDNTPGKRKELVQRLRAAGCDVDTSGTDWLTSGDLTPPSAIGGGLPLGKRVSSSPVPREPKLRARFAHTNSKSFSTIFVRNLGPGEVRDLEVEVLDDAIAQFCQPVEGVGMPVKRVPEGNEAPVLRFVHVLASPSTSRFEVRISATSENGETIEQTAFIGSESN